MVAPTIYHNPRCSTSRKTLDVLRDNGVEPNVVQYLKTPPSRAELIEAAGTAKGTRLARPIDTVHEIL